MALWLLSSACTLLAVSCCVCAENILFLQSTPSKSHHIWNRQIFDRLYENGHNLTILSFEKETSVPGKTFLVMEGFYEKMMAAFADGSADFSSYEHAFGNIMNVFEYYTVCGGILEEQEAIRRLLEYPKTFRFDLIIHDFTMGQFLLGFLEHFRNPPLVSISPYNIPSYTQYLADIPLYPTYVPHPASSFSSHMSFIERVRNTLYWAFDMLYRQLVYMPNENERMRRVFPGANLTHVKLLERRSELVLVNSDPTLDFYQLLPPNVVQVGGLHIKRAEEMPAMMKQFIARASRGVILFSFGTNVQSEMLGPEVNRQLLELFRSMPEYGFIWKHANAEKMTMPPNVLMTAWVPQSAVLADGRTKLLVSHGGLLSLQEAAWNGVPVIGVPFFADQFSNVRRIEVAGIGVGIPSTKLNAETLKEAMDKLLNEPGYRARAKELSIRFRTQPETPLDRAIFWIEKVIAGKGLRYLRSPARDLAPYQVYGLDMVAVVLLIVLGYYLIFKRHSKPPATAGDAKAKTE